MTDLIIELGCEDLPAHSVLPMAQHLGQSISASFKAAGLCDADAQLFATPRRIAALWSTVGERQSDQQIEKKGPSKAAAFGDDGAPSKALAGFLKGAKATESDISYVDTPKGEWVVVKQTVAGKTLAEVLAVATAEAFKTMPMPKRMRWSDRPHEFLRPVVWLLAMHGSNTVPLSLFGLDAGNATYGHRFHAPNAITLNNASDYAAALRGAKVEPDFNERKTIIQKQVAELANALGGKVVSDDALLDEVCALVEWPVSVAGKFEQQYLEIPKEALIQTMQENQRYFALLDNNDNLLPAFVTVANIESNNTASIVEGNERVIRPRFADTMFFWEQDKQKTLSDHQAQLGSLLFQEKLGSVADKVSRMKKISAWVGAKAGASLSDCELAASLCKCDLNTEIVKELAKMQGIAGRYYAQRDGHNDDVSAAMEEHYFPKQAGGALPSNAVAQSVALADKVDTLVGIYGLGLKPTGAKDPFALRRSALGVVRILNEKQLDIDLSELYSHTVGIYGNVLPADFDQNTLVQYTLERLKGYAIDQGFSVDAIDAVLANEVSNPLDIFARLEAIKQFRDSSAAPSLSAASKRIANILKKAGKLESSQVDEKLLQEPAEIALANTLSGMSAKIDEQMQSRQYQEAMLLLATLKEPVDTFFDDVMVMSEDDAVRNNRLAMLQALNGLCTRTADLSRLQPQES